MSRYSSGQPHPNVFTVACCGGQRVLIPREASISAPLGVCVLVCFVCDGPTVRAGTVAERVTPVPAGVTFTAP